jgi:6-phosphofructokinase 1
MANGKLGILVGGGPAPGINGVISAATIEARMRGLDVVGLREGYSRIMKGDTSCAVPLQIADVSRIHFQGGSILGTARANPAKDPKDLETCARTINELGITHMVTIGGDDTAYGASEVSKALGPAVVVAHVPKTIDNDLPLPENECTFGYQTARAIGTGIVQNLMEDAKTTGRWYFLVAMGRHAGHLALGIGKAAGATLTIIREEFPEGNIPFAQVCDILDGSILKRLARGQKHGVAIMAEGLSERFSEEDLEKLGNIERDGYGHLRLAEVDLGKMVKGEVAKRFKDRGNPITIVSKDIGYELRCAPPIPYDCEYVRELGYGAVKYLLDIAPVKNDTVGVLVSIVGGKLQPIPFDKMLDPVTHKTKVRMVDTQCEAYEVARRYMIRLEKEDFDSPAQLERLATLAGMDANAFKGHYGYLGA